MAGKVSNPRDLLLQLLGETLYVERRLTGGVLRDLIQSVHDEQLKEALQHHLDQTKEHPDRLETAFRRLEAAPSANIAADFEAAVKAHEELASSIVDQTLQDVFHVQAALRTEHLEIALYTAVLAFDRDELQDLRESLADEHEARETLEGIAGRLAHAG
jgi:ferritin-like metal-binding protein YciE